MIIQFKLFSLNDLYFLLISKIFIISRYQSLNYTCVSTFAGLNSRSNGLDNGVSIRITLQSFTLAHYTNLNIDFIFIFL